MSDNEGDAPPVKTEVDPTDEGAPAAPEDAAAEPAAEAAPAEAGLGLDDDDDDDDGPVVARRRDRRAAVLEDDDDDDDDEDPAAAKKKKRKAQLELDEDDYDLLEDNQVTGFKRKEKKKRLQKASDRDKPKTAKTLQDVERDLFGDGDDEEEADAEPKKAAPEEVQLTPAEEDFDEDSEDEFADFIEREEGEQPRRKLKSKMAGVVRPRCPNHPRVFNPSTPFPNAPRVSFRSPPRMIRNSFRDSLVYPSSDLTPSAPLPIPFLLYNRGANSSRTRWTSSATSASSRNFSRAATPRRRRRRNTRLTRRRRRTASRSRTRTRTLSTALISPRRRAGRNAAARARGRACLSPRSCASRC